MSQMYGPYVILPGQILLRKGWRGRGGEREWRVKGRRKEGSQREKERYKVREK